MLIDQPAEDKEELANFLATPEGKSSKKRYDLARGAAVATFVVTGNLCAIAILQGWPATVLILSLGILVPAGVMVITITRSLWKADRAAFLAGKDQTQREKSKRGYRQLLKDKEL